MIKPLLLLLQLYGTEYSVYPFRSPSFVNWILRNNVGEGMGEEIQSLIFVKKARIKLVIVVNICNPSTWKTEVLGRIKNQRPAWTRYHVSNHQTNQANKTQNKIGQATRGCFYCYLISSSRQDKVTYKQSLSILVYDNLASMILDSVVHLHTGHLVSGICCLPPLFSSIFSQQELSSVPGG